MYFILGFVVGVLFAAAFPAPSLVIRSMVGYLWNSVTAVFKSKSGSDTGSGDPKA